MGEITINCSDISITVSNFLDERKQTALLALCDGEPLAKAAKLAGVSRRSLYDWISEDRAFMAALNEKIMALVYVKVLKSAPHTERAIDTILGIMDDPAVKPSTRLNAAVEILKVTDTLSNMAANSQIALLREGLQELVRGNSDE